MIATHSISDRAAATLEMLLTSHTNDPATGRCRHHGVPFCGTYRTVIVDLTMAGRRPMPRLDCAGHNHGAPA
jgi:hypothetical protein